MFKKKFKRCILHIGGEKTGSTSLQLALTDAREGLLQSGVYVPDRAVFRGNNWGFVSIARHEPRPTSTATALKPGESHADRIAELRRQYEDDFRNKARKCDHILVSSEHLQTKTDCQGIEELLEWIGSFAEECLLVYVARRQDNVLRSLYSTALRAAASTSFMFNPINFQRSQSPRLNHWVAITRYLAYPDKVPIKVRVVPYPEGAAARTQFWLTLQSALDLPVALSMAEEANSALGLTNSRFLTTLFHPTMAQHLRFERTERLKLLEELSAMADRDRVQPSRDWALGVLDGYKHCNRLLQDTFMRDQGDVFDLNVDMYPEISSGVIGMTLSEFFAFIEAAPGVASIIADVGKPPDTESFYTAIREKTHLL